MFILKKTYSLLLGLLIILGSFFFWWNIENFSVWNFSETFIESTYAQQANTNNNANNVNTNNNKSEAENVHQLMNTAISAINILWWVLAAMISPLILAVGWLMSPDWTTGDIFGMRKALYDLWVAVSNVVYIIYAILLIFIALATIFNNQNYNYKKLLPKLLIGILMIPLTYWAVQIIISISTTATNVVLSVPMETMNNLASKQGKTWWTDNIIPKKIVVHGWWNGSTKQWEKELTLKELCKDASQCISPQQMMKDASGIYGSLLIYAYGIFQVQNIDTIKTEGIDVIMDFWDIVQQSLIGLIMYIVFGLLVIALVMMLIFRVFWLMVYTIFSPLFTLNFVLWGKWELWKFSITEFIGTAFVPAVLGIVLSLGLILISTIHTSFNTATNKNTWEWSSSWWTEKTLLTIMWNPKNTIKQVIVERAPKEWDKDKNKYQSKIVVTIGWFSLEFYGSTRQSGEFKSGDGGRGIMSLFGEFIIQIIAIAFLWTAFLAASKTSRIADSVMKPFEQMAGHVKDWWWAIAKAFPVPFVGNIGGVEKTLGWISWEITSSISNRHKDSYFGKKEEERKQQLDNGKSPYSSSLQKQLDNAKNQINSLKERPDSNTEWEKVSVSIQNIINGNYGKTEIDWALKDIMKEIHRVSEGDMNKIKTMLNNIKSNGGDTFKDMDVSELAKYIHTFNNTTTAAKLQTGVSEKLFTWKN